MHSMNIRILLLAFLSMLLISCVGTVIGAAVDTTIEVAKVPFKVVGAAVDLAVPDDDDERK
jgi:hypothetical protein